VTPGMHGQRYRIYRKSHGEVLGKGTGHGKLGEPGHIFVGAREKGCQDPILPILPFCLAFCCRYDGYLATSRHGSVSTCRNRWSRSAQTDGCRSVSRGMLWIGAPQRQPASDRVRHSDRGAGRALSSGKAPGQSRVTWLVRVAEPSRPSRFRSRLCVSGSLGQAAVSALVSNPGPQAATPGELFPGDRSP